MHMSCAHTHVHIRMCIQTCGDGQVEMDKWRWTSGDGHEDMDMLIVYLRLSAQVDEDLEINVVKHQMFHSHFGAVGKKQRCRQNVKLHYLMSDDEWVMSDGGE
jgi:hypothetical protein